MRSTRRLLLIPAALVAAAAFSAAILPAAAKDNPKTQPTQPATAPAKAPEKPPERPKNIDEAYALDFYRQYLPEAFTFVRIVQEKDRKTYDEKIKRQMIEDTRRLVDLKFRKPEWFEPSVKDSRLTFRTTQLSKDLRTPDPRRNEADAARMRKELSDLVGELFAVRQELRRLRLAEEEKRFEEFRKHVEGLARQLKEKEDNKAALIGKYVEGLLLPKPPRDDL